MRSIFLTIFASFFAVTAQADQQYICSGEIGNAYLRNDLRYQAFGEHTVLLTTQCGSEIVQAGQGDCSYIFDGSQYHGYLTSSGLFLMDYPSSSSLQGNILIFKMSDPTADLVGNEGQRWFIGACTKIN